jgi:glycosyltransferase involved in cell wall biosynthesis
MISVIIPAHDEGSVIARTLKAMTDGAEPRELEIVVVCNGCTDETADVARGFRPRVRVIETSIASKTHALNLGDDAAQGFPRIYADADIILSIDAIRRLTERLEIGDALAVAPTPNFDLSACSWPVRACYEIRSLLPSAQEGIGGSGVYALSEAGRARFGEFPKLTADDGFVRIHFRGEERATLVAVHSTVFPPRTVRDLVATKTRAHYGSYELAKLFPKLWENRGESNNNSLVRLFRNPLLWPRLVVYSVVTLLAKRRARKRIQAGAVKWERDNTSRVSAKLSALKPSHPSVAASEQPVERA